MSKLILAGTQEWLRAQVVLKFVAEEVMTKLHGCYTASQAVAKTNRVLKQEVFDRICDVTDSLCMTLRPDYKPLSRDQANDTWLLLLRRYTETQMLVLREINDYYMDGARKKLDLHMDIYNMHLAALRKCDTELMKMAQEGAM